MSEHRQWTLPCSMEGVERHPLCSMSCPGASANDKAWPTSSLIWNCTKCWGYNGPFVKWSPIVWSGLSLQSLEACADIYRYRRSIHASLMIFAHDGLVYTASVWRYFYFGCCVGDNQAETLIYIRWKQI